MEEIKMDIITEKQIKKFLVKHYIKDKKDLFYDNMLNRNLNKSIHYNYGKIGDVHYSLEGTPPKGYAMYIRDSRFKLIYYDSIGEIIGKQDKVKINEIEKKVAEEKRKKINNDRKK